MDESLIWSKEFTVSNYAIDPFGRLKLVALFEWFQHAASSDAIRKGFGFEDLKKNNRYWVLIRALIHISRLPLWDERVIFRTWPKDMAGIVAFRDFEILSLQGDRLITGTSSWSQIDMANRRPVRLNHDDYASKTADLNAIAERAGKVVVNGPFKWSNPQPVRNSHIDVQWHVNNTRYLEWIYNELPLEWLKTHQLSEITVNFLSEARLGDEYCCAVNKDPDGQWTGVVKRYPDNKLLFAVKLIFEPAKEIE